MAPGRNMRGIRLHAFGNQSVACLLVVNSLGAGRSVTNSTAKCDHGHWSIPTCTHLVVMHVLHDLIYHATSWTSIGHKHCCCSICMVQEKVAWVSRGNHNLCTRWEMYFMCWALDQSHVCAISPHQSPGWCELGCTSQEWGCRPHY